MLALSRAGKPCAGALCGPGPCQVCFTQDVARVTCLPETHVLLALPWKRRRRPRPVFTGRPIRCVLYVLVQGRNARRIQRESDLQAPELFA